MSFHLHWNTTDQIFFVVSVGRCAVYIDIAIPRRLFVLVVYE